MWIEKDPFTRARDATTAINRGKDRHVHTHARTTAQTLYSYTTLNNHIPCPCCLYRGTPARAQPSAWARRLFLIPSCWWDWLLLLIWRSFPHRLARGPIRLNSVPPDDKKHHCYWSILIHVHVHRLLWVYRKHKRKTKCSKFNYSYVIDVQTVFLFSSSADWPSNVKSNIWVTRSVVDACLFIWITVHVTRKSWWTL